PPTQLPTTLIILSPFFFTDTPTTEIYTLSLRRSSDLLRQTFGRCPFRRREPNPPPIGTGRSPGIVEQGFSLPVKLQRELHLARRDRKSTRLNSSHDQISYAVFCLKKKKKNIHRRYLYE